MNNCFPLLGHRIAIILLVALSFSAKIDAQIITSIAGTGSAGFSGDGGPATAAAIDGATFVSFDAAGNLYFPDYTNNRIRKIDASGIITTVVGNGSAGYSGDGGAATAAQLSNPSYVTFHGGEMYIADYYNHVIRKVSATGIITTVVGSGSGGFSGDGGAATAASLYFPTSIAFDASNNMFIADEANDRIRKVTFSGTISTYAGGGSSSAGGVPATTCSLYRPGGVTTDATGNVYITDVGNARICKVNVAGTLTIYAGTGTAGYGGDGGPATAAALDHPLRLVIDSVGTLYFGDQGNNRARKITAAGIISTIAGTGTAGFSGDGGLATAANLNGPQGVCPDRLGNIYIVDASNYRIRKIVNCGSVIRPITGSDTLCLGTRDTLADATPGGSWSSSNTSIATISTNGIVTGIAAGSVIIRYIVTSFCGSDTAIYNVTIKSGGGCPASVSSQQLAVGSFKIYPNPNTGSFIVTFSSGSNDESKITITNILGQTVKELSLQSNKETEVRLNVPPGLYFISVVTNGERVMEKFVVE